MVKKRVYKPKISRIAFIQRKVRTATKRGLVAKAEDLASEYEVCKDTIVRDLRHMRDMLDLPLEYDEKRHGWYFTELSYSMEHFQLSESDLFAICIAERALAQFEGSPVYQNLQNVFQKITESLPPKATTVMPELSSDITMRSFPVTVATGEAWKKMFKALREKHTVRIQYQKPADKTPAWREIDPYHAVNYQGSWYVLGYCHSKGEARVFHLSRIKQAEETMKEFTVPDDFNPEKLLSNSFDMYVGRETKMVRVIFSSVAAPYIKERHWHPTQKLEEMEDGSLIFSAAVSNLTGIIPWIFSWGPNALILEPFELIEEFKNDLNRTVKNYTE